MVSSISSSSPSCSSSSRASEPSSFIASFNTMVEQSPSPLATSIKGGKRTTPVTGAMISPLFGVSPFIGASSANLGNFPSIATFMNTSTDETTLQEQINPTTCGSRGSSSCDDRNKNMDTAKTSNAIGGEKTPPEKQRQISSPQISSTGTSFSSASNRGTKRSVPNWVSENDETIEPYVRRRRHDGDHSSDVSDERRNKRRAEKSLTEEEAETKRIKINSRERKRMHDLNWALRELKQVLPAPLLMSAKGEIAGGSRGTTKFESMSKTKTIITAKNWISQLLAEVSKLSAENEELHLRLRLITDGSNSGDNNNEIYHSSFQHSIFLADRNKVNGGTSCSSSKTTKMSEERGRTNSKQCKFSTKSEHSMTSQKTPTHFKSIVSLAMPKVPSSQLATPKDTNERSEDGEQLQLCDSENPGAKKREFDNETFFMAPIPTSVGENDIVDINTAGRDLALTTLAQQQNHQIQPMAGQHRQYRKNYTRKIAENRDKIATENGILSMAHNHQPQSSSQTQNPSPTLMRMIASSMPIHSNIAWPGLPSLIRPVHPAMVQNILTQQLNPAVAVHLLQLLQQQQLIPFPAGQTEKRL